MSKTAKATVRVELLGDGDNIIDADTTSNAAAVAPTSLAATTAFQQVTIPSGVLGLKIKPPPTNTATITIAGAAGDVGIACHASNPTYLALPAVSPGPLYIKIASGTATILLVWS